jgi:hypothetical protein
MDARERFKRITRFQSVDRAPLCIVVESGKIAVSCPSQPACRGAFTSISSDYASSKET